MNVISPTPVGPGLHGFVGDDLALATAEGAGERHPTQQLEGAGAGLVKGRSDRP